MLVPFRSETRVKSPNFWERMQSCGLVVVLSAVALLLPAPSRGQAATAGYDDQGCATAGSEQRERDWACGCAY